MNLHLENSDDQNVTMRNHQALNFVNNDGNFLIRLDGSLHLNIVKNDGDIVADADETHLTSGLGNENWLKSDSYVANDGNFTITVPSGQSACLNIVNNEGHFRILDNRCNGPLKDLRDRFGKHGNANIFKASYSSSSNDHHHDGHRRDDHSAYYDDHQVYNDRHSFGHSSFQDGGQPDYDGTTVQYVDDNNNDFSSDLDDNERVILNDNNGDIDVHVDGTLYLDFQGDNNGDVSYDSHSSHLKSGGSYRAWQETTDFRDNNGDLDLHVPAGKTACLTFGDNNGDVSITGPDASSSHPHFHNVGPDDSNSSIVVNDSNGYRDVKIKHNDGTVVRKSTDPSGYTKVTVTHPDGTSEAHMTGPDGKSVDDRNHSDTQQAGKRRPKAKNKAVHHVHVTKRPAGKPNASHKSDIHLGCGTALTVGFIGFLIAVIAAIILKSLEVFFVIILVCILLSAVKHLISKHWKK